MRGYDPAEVDRRIEELDQAVTALTHQRDGLSARVEELHHEASSPAKPPSYDHLGARVGKILSLADTEAEELRARAKDEAEALKAAAIAESDRSRDEADRYATRVRSEADADAARILEDA